jgi:hypothetical protein
MRGYRYPTLLACAFFAAAVMFRAWYSVDFSIRPDFKQSRLASAAAARAAGTSCRILIVGGSAMAYGVSASELQRKLGCEVVNAALLGISDRIGLLLAAMSAELKAGDTVIVSDPQWSAAVVHQSACSDLWMWACWADSITWVPHLAEYFTSLSGGGPRRTPRGDMIDYPSLLMPAEPSRTRVLNDMDYRVSVIRRQIAMIRARGARPVLAPIPLFVSPEVKPALHAEFARLKQIVGPLLGREGVWIDEQLETDEAYFGIDGHHASPAGRTRWTESVAIALKVRPVYHVTTTDTLWPHTEPVPSYPTCDNGCASTGISTTPAVLIGTAKQNP